MDSELEPETRTFPGTRMMRVRTAVAIVVAAGVLAAGAGVVGGRLLTLGGHGDASAEAGFARDMSTHHAQAVEMGMLAHTRSADAVVRTLGGDIALSQHGQIGIMQTWLKAWDLAPTGRQPAMAWMNHPGHPIGGSMPGMATSAEMTHLRDATGREFDILFAQLMIRHHLGGIAMAEAALQLSDDQEVLWLAGAMKAGQQSDLNALQDILRQNGVAGR